jgi:hypothetical protein
MRFLTNHGVGMRRVIAGCVTLGLAAVGVTAAPQPANAWWHHGYGWHGGPGWCCGVSIPVPPMVVAPAPVYVAPPAYYRPPVYAPAP